MNFGTKLKKLRVERDMTQEELAEFLSISPQAISRWETGNAMPDISLFPLLCNLFEVTSDYLLGIDIANKEEIIADISANADRYSSKARYKEAREILEEGLRSYPNSFKLIHDLMYVSSFEEDNAETDAEAKAKREESKRLAKRILDGCTVDKFRHGAIQILCMAYCTENAYDKAKELAESMPGICISRDFLLEYAAKGNNLFEVKRNLCSSLLDELLLKISNLNTKLNSGKWAYSEDESAILRKKCIGIIELIIEDGNYGFYNEHLSINHSLLAKYYAKKGEKANMLEHLNKSADAAIGFIKWMRGGEYTCLLFKGIKKSWIGTNENNNTAKQLLDYLENKVFDSYRDEKAFREIKEKLSCFADRWEVNNT